MNTIPSNPLYFPMPSNYMPKVPYNPNIQNIQTSILPPNKNHQKPFIPQEYSLTPAGKNGNLIVVILDESSSMLKVHQQTISAFNEFVEGQKGVSDTTGAGFLTLVKFAAPHINVVYENRPLTEVPELTYMSYNPCGGTNLNDAIGQAIASVNNTLSVLSEESRPGVIVVVMTDGEENASLNFSTAEIKSIVSAAEKADWSFTFLGANIDAFAVSAAYGMNKNATLSFNVNNMAETLGSASAAVSSMRMMKSAGMNTQAIYASGLYSEEDRAKSK